MLTASQPLFCVYHNGVDEKVRFVREAEARAYMEVVASRHGPVVWHGVNTLKAGGHTFVVREVADFQ